VSPEYKPEELTLELTHSKYFWCENVLLRGKTKWGKRGHEEHERFDVLIAVCVNI
jgi:hypothetical protein